MQSVILVVMWFLRQLLGLLTMTGVMAATLCCASVIGASQMPEEQKRRYNNYYNYDICMKQTLETLFIFSLLS